MESHDGHISPILIVEDDLTWQTILTSFCEGAGYTVVAAYDARDALQKSRRLQPPPLLALVDLELLSSAPQKLPYDGMWVLTDFAEQGIYTIIVSGNIHAEDTLLERPEIYSLVDKYHFSKANFGEDVFVSTVREAIAYAQAAHRAEGQLPEQQARLDSLPFAPPSTP